MVSSATYASGAFATGLPAVLSQDVIGRLRGLGFNGVVVTDDLDAPGPSVDPRFADVAVRAVTAGVDLLLFVDTSAARPRRPARRWSTPSSAASFRATGWSTPTAG